MNEVAQDVGRLEGRMDGLSTRIEQMEKSIEKLTGLVEELKQGQDQFKGGYAILTALVSLAAAVGGSITWVIEHVAFK